MQGIVYKAMRKRLHKQAQLYQLRHTCRHKLEHHDEVLELSNYLMLRVQDIMD